MVQDEEEFPANTEVCKGSPTKYCAIGPEIPMKSDLISASLALCMPTVAKVKIALTPDP